MPRSSATLRDFFTSHRKDRPKPEAAEGDVVALGDSVSVAVKDANSRYTPGTPGNDWATALIPRR